MSRVDLAAEEVREVWESGAVERAAMDRRAAYERGEQAILHREGVRRDGRPYNRLVVNWVESLVSRQVGFLTDRPFTVSAMDGIGAPEDGGAQAEAEAAVDGYGRLRDALRLDSVDSRLFRRALIHGWAVEAHGYGPRGPEIREYDPREWVFVEDGDGREAAAVRRLNLPAGTWHGGRLLDEGLEMFWLYDEETVRVFEVRRETGGTGGGRMEELSARRHPYGRLPVVRWAALPERRPFVTDAMMGLQDAYNRTLSAHHDDVETDIDSLLAIHGANPSELTRVNPATGRTLLQELREQGAIVFQDHDTRAEFLTRRLSHEKVAFTLHLVRTLLHIEGSAPDLEDIVGATGSTSGIALRLQYQAMVERAGEFRRHVEESLRERLDLLNRIWGLKGTPLLERYHVNISFSVPANEIEIWRNINYLEPLLSRLDRARLVPSIDDPAAAAASKAREEEAAERRAEKGQEARV